MKVKDVMTPNPVCCAPGTTLKEAAQLMDRHDCGAIPVIENGKPVGIVTDRDIATRGVARERNVSELTVRDLMTQPVQTVSQDDDLDDCLERMADEKIRRVVVVDESGGCVGIVAQADVAQHARKAQAGEVVREISRPSA